eukprot:m.169968 g.169968  ORF g.169968 m.169968 type:complete len:86 (-) comp17818_c0_seq10:110-367(-)
MALSVWRMATVPGGWGFTVFWHPEYETIVELCHGSIGWYRFQEDKGTKPRICWSRGDLGNQVGNDVRPKKTTSIKSQVTSHSQIH